MYCRIACRVPLQLVSVLTNRSNTIPLVTLLANMSLLPEDVPRARLPLQLASSLTLIGRPGRRTVLDLGVSVGSRRR